MTAGLAAAIPLPHDGELVGRVRERVGEVLRGEGAVLLAVSGGRDSMALLDAALMAAPAAIAAVATFDHGTGLAARRAVALVRRVAAARGVRVIAERAALAGAGEAAWREARWRFLRRAAERVGAGWVATAHTRDDQVETVAMRILRGAGARGLAGLYAPTAGVVRPLLELGRAEVAAYAAAAGVAWRDDPSNTSRRFLRNRVRLDLLPALERARPGFAEGLLDVARRAAAWRAEVEALADAVAWQRDASGGLHVATDLAGRYDADGWAVLWPALAARVGVRLDRRGTARLVAFTRRVAAEAATGARMQLAGGADVVVRRGAIVLRPHAPPATPRRERAMDALRLDGAGDVRFGRFRFRRVAEVREGDAWSAELPAEGPLTVRTWRAGDRMQGVGGRAARRVKRFFADARIPGVERAGWPVIEAGDAVVWIPGVRCGHAVTGRAGVPARRYLCELIDD